MGSHDNELYPTVLMFPALVVFGVFLILPVLAAFVLGFTDWNIDWLTSPQFNGISNFVYIFSDEYFLLALKNTFIFAVITVLFKIVFGLILAIGLNFQSKGSNFLRTLFYLPAVMSMVVIGIIFSSIFRMEGLFNHFLTFINLPTFQKDWLGNPHTALYTTIIADIWRWSGFNMAIFLAGLQSIPKDYYESARIDGASSLRQIISITIPLLLPSFIVNITFNMIGGLKVFEQVFVITGGGPGYSSQVLSTYIYNTFSKGLLGRSTAMGLILFFIVYLASMVLNFAFKKKEGIYD